MKSNAGPWEQFELITKGPRFGLRHKETGQYYSYPSLVPSDPAEVGEEEESKKQPLAEEEDTGETAEESPQRIKASLKASPMQVAN